MNRPDPVQHMMIWGASSATILLLVYFALIGVLDLPNLDPSIFGLMLAGIFTGFTLGGMAGVIIGTIFKHEQEVVTSGKIDNRRNLVLLAVFMMVLVLSRVLIIVAQGAIGHPLTLSLMMAFLAAIASQHYLQRMETWLKHNKPKRKMKNEAIPSRLLDDNTALDDLTQAHKQTSKHDSK